MGDGTMLKYFWDEKEDVTRFTGWEECKDKFPLVQRAMENLELAKMTMQAAVDKAAEEDEDEY
jgi:hypothetical protein